MPRFCLCWTQRSMDLHRPGRFAIVRKGGTVLLSVLPASGAGLKDQPSRKLSVLSWRYDGGPDIRHGASRLQVACLRPPQKDRGGERFRRHLLGGRCGRYHVLWRHGMIGGENRRAAWRVHGRGWQCWTRATSLWAACPPGPASERCWPRSRRPQALLRWRRATTNWVADPRHWPVSLDKVTFLVVNGTADVSPSNVLAVDGCRTMSCGTGG